MIDQDEVTLLEVAEHIHTLPAEDRELCVELANEIVDLVERTPRNDLAALALALVISALAADCEDDCH